MSRRRLPSHHPVLREIDEDVSFSVAPPAPEHSQTALLTSESIGGSCHCPAEVLVRVWHIYPSHVDDSARREPMKRRGGVCRFR